MRKKEFIHASSNAKTIPQKTPNAMLLHLSHPAYHLTALGQGFSLTSGEWASSDA
jgi:hypothetical protein